MKNARLLASAAAMLLSMSAAFAQATKLAFTTQPTGNKPGVAFATAPVVEAQDASGVTDTGYTGPITIAINAGDAVGGAALSGTKTVNAVNGVATFAGLSINLPGAYRLTATSGTLVAATSAAAAVTTTLAEVYTVTIPTTTDPAITANGFNQLRAFAVNANPGSPYKGYMYVTRRDSTNVTIPGPAAVFFWKGSSTLRAGGPDASTADGKFDLTGVTPGGNAFWAIGVAEDDYVYVSGLTSGSLYRFNPDGTNGTLVVAAPNFERCRQIFITGKGINTVIWYIKDNGTPAPVVKWTATAVDANGAPTAFSRSALFTVPVENSQAHQMALTSTGDAMFYSFFGGVPGPRKYAMTGAADATYNPANLYNESSGLSLDSEDRVLYAAYSNTSQMSAHSPITGANITDDGTGVAGLRFKPSGFTYNFSGQYVELSCYSDRHIFYLGNGASAGNGTQFGVFNTGMPAPRPVGASVANPGTGSSLNLSWTLPKDAEVIGVNIYRSTSADVEGVKVNSAPVTALTYGDSGLTSGTKYYYTLKSAAVDPFTGAAYESLGAAQVTGTPAFVGVPDAPAGITAADTKLGGSVLISWTTPAQYADAIRIYRSTESGTLGALAKTINAPAAGAAASYTDTGLTNDIAVYYTVKAVNGKNEESVNTAQVSATPTDQTLPAFAGLTSIKDLGFPGFRLNWAAAVDASAPITYKVYVASSPSALATAAPATITTNTTADITGMPLGQDAYFLVKAVDPSGNVDANTAVLSGTPSRVIVDSDVNAKINFENVNFQPDPNFPALLPVAIGAGKGGGLLEDIVQSGFASGVYYSQTNDKKGKVQYTVPINTAGTYDISAFWSYMTTINTPGYVYHITLPNGTKLPDVTMDQTGATGSKWNLLATQDLTVGDLVIVGDATASTDVDPLHENASGAIRALLHVVPTNVPIYKTATPPTIDGNITAAEWAGASDIVLGRAYQSLIAGGWTGPADYSSHVYLKWDATNLYVGEIATDDVVSLPVNGGSTSFQNDGLELYLGLNPASDPARTAYDAGFDYQVLLSAFGTTGTSYSPQLALPLANAVVAYKRTTTGYNLEATIPWSDLVDPFAVQPAENQVIGLDIHGNDNDQATANTDSAFGLSGLQGSWGNPQSWIKGTLKGLPPTAVKGDINADGVFDNADLLEAIKVAAGISSINALQLPRADVAGAGADGRSADGKVDMKDVARLRRALNGKDTL